VSVGWDDSLAQRLRAGTKDLHHEVERAGIMPALLRGQLDRGTYCALLRNLHAVYAALEPALLRHATHPAVAPVVAPACFRQSALADDLATLHGDSWAQDFELKAATRQYVARLQALERDRPEALVAHAYVRTLGDLSGGQLLRRIVATAFALGTEAGTRFYDFGSAAEVGAHLQRFRDGLDRLDANAGAIDELVAEARWAFQLHGTLFVELAPTAALGG
jgi:heme oxygenase